MNLLTMVVHTYLSHQVTDRSQYINTTLTPVGKLSQQITNTHGQRHNAYTSGWCCPFHVKCVKWLQPEKKDLFTAAMLGTNIWVNAGVSNDTNQGSVAFWPERAQMLLLCPSAHWRGSATLNGTQPCNLALTAPVPTGHFLFIVLLWKEVVVVFAPVSL